MINNSIIVRLKICQNSWFDKIFQENFGGIKYYLMNKIIQIFTYYLIDKFFKI